jgi:hypothetical protein
LGAVAPFLAAGFWAVSVAMFIPPELLHRAHAPGVLWRQRIPAGAAVETSFHFPNEALSETYHINGGL